MPSAQALWTGRARVGFAATLVAATACAAVVVFAAPLRAADRPSAGLASPSDGIWRPISGPPRYNGRTVYDSKRRRMVMFRDKWSLWAMNLDVPGQWCGIPTQPNPAQSPNVAFPSNVTAVIYEPLEDRLILAGLASPGAAGDVWELAFTSDPPMFTKLETGGIGNAHQGCSVVFDSKRNRMLMFGGYVGYCGSGCNPDVNEVVELTLGLTPTWSVLSPSGAPPTPRSNAAAIYDPVRDRMVVYGGDEGLTSDDKNDLFELALAPSLAWSPIAPTETLPPAEYSIACYDPRLDRMLGFVEGIGTWSLALSGPPVVSTLTSVGDTPQYVDPFTYAGILDPVNNDLLTIGYVTELGQVMRLHLDGIPTWSEIVAHPGGTPPPSLVGAGVLDPEGDQFVYCAPFGTRQETWTLPLDGFGEGWSRLSVSATPPLRVFHTVVLDPGRRRLLLFGGKVGSTYMNDVWALSLTGTPEWSPIAVSGEPPSPRAGHAAIFDPVGDRMIVFGGEGAISNGSLWELRFSGTPQWNPLTAVGVAPYPFTGAAATYDPIRRRMMQIEESGATFALDLTDPPAWESIPPGPSGLKPSVTYDSRRDRLLLQKYDARNTFELPLGDAPLTWRSLQPGGPDLNGYQYPAVGYDARRDRMVLMGSVDRTTWLLQFSGALSADGAPGAATAGPRLYPNPAHAAVTLEYALRRPGRLSVVVHDVTGRAIRRVFDGSRAAGPVRLVWDGRDDVGHRVAPGVYLCRIDAPDGRAWSRFAFVE